MRDRETKKEREEKQGERLNKEEGKNNNVAYPSVCTSVSTTLSLKTKSIGRAS